MPSRLCVAQQPTAQPLHYQSVVYLFIFCHAISLVITELKRHPEFNAPENKAAIAALKKVRVQTTHQLGHLLEHWTTNRHLPFFVSLGRAGCDERNWIPEPDSGQKIR